MAHVVYHMTTTTTIIKSQYFRCMHPYHTRDLQNKAYAWRSILFVHLTKKIRLNQLFCCCRKQYSTIHSSSQCRRIPKANFNIWHWTNEWLLSSFSASLFTFIRLSTSLSTSPWISFVDLGFPLNYFPRIPTIIQTIMLWLVANIVRKWRQKCRRLAKYSTVIFAERFICL